MVLCSLLAMTLYWVSTAAAATTETVDSDGDAGWFPRQSNCGTAPSTSSHTFRPGPVGPPPQSQPPAGAGSLNLQIGPNGSTREEMHNGRFEGVRLDDLLASGSILEYWTFVEASTLDTSIEDEHAPYLILEIDRDANGLADDQLVYEPPYNGDVQLATWQRWDARAGTWWSADDVRLGNGALPGNGLGQTLAIYRGRFPSAQITNSSGVGGLRIVAGCGGMNWAGFAGNVDALTVKANVHDVRFDFEPAVPTPSPSTSTRPPQPSRTTASPSPSRSTGSPSPSPSTSSPSPDPTETTDPRCRPEPGQNVITGSNRSERIRGTRGKDLICSFGGNDVVEGLGGNDELLLGPGNDTGVGAGGNDRISGAGGRDSLRGGGGADRLNGGRQRDTCNGGPGRDRFSSCERRRR